MYTYWTVNNTHKNNSNRNNNRNDSNTQDNVHGAVIMMTVRVQLTYLIHVHSTKWLLTVNQLILWVYHYTAIIYTHYYQPI